MTTYLLLVNPKSGRGRALFRAEALRAGLAASASVEVVQTRGRGHASDVAAERAGDFERVVAIGGDGTLNEVLTGLMRVGAAADALPALGFLPSGTANAAVLAFDFSGAPEAVAERLPDAPVRAVDVGVVSHGGSERPFLLWFGAGYDAVVIDALNRERTGHMGVAGLLRGMPGVLWAVHGYPAADIRVSVEGAVASTAASVVLANVGQMAFGGTAVRSADPFDGRLDLLTVPRTGTVGVAGLWLRMMTSSLGRVAGVGHERVTRVHLESTGEVPFQLDGEPAGMLPAEVRIEPGAVRLLMTWPGGRRITRQVAGYAE